MSRADDHFAARDQGLQSYQTLLARLRENEQLARRFFDIQTSVLATRNFQDFFSRLLGTIQDRLQVPYVWLSLVHPSKVAAHVRRLSLGATVNWVTREQLLRVLGAGGRPVLINRNIRQVQFLRPEQGQVDFRSIAITPIHLDGHLIGSFNQADPSPMRFHPDLDCSFLAQLGLVVSISLANVMAHEELQVLAYTDALTGLLNRRALEQILRRELARARRYGAPLSLVFVDLDDFKPVNDRYGHDRGDELLAYVAATFSDLSRDTDVIARFGGDEFVLILPGISARDAQAFMERLQDHLLAHPLPVPGGTLPIRFSYGIARADQVRNVEEFINRADEALYAAKKARAPLPTPQP